MNANVDLVVAGALLHDVGKVEAYEIDGGGFGHTPSGFLLGHVVLGCLMLERRLAAAGRHLGGVGPSRAGETPSSQGQWGFREYGVPKTAASAAEGSSLRTTTSIASPDRSTRVKSRYRP